MVRWRVEALRRLSPAKFFRPDHCLNSDRVSGLRRRGPDIWSQYGQLLDSYWSATGHRPDTASGASGNQELALLALLAGARCGAFPCPGAGCRRNRGFGSRRSDVAANGEGATD